MRLYRQENIDKIKPRKSKLINISIQELPERNKPILDSPKAIVKYIKYLEKLVRHSPEYREYMKFLKANLDMNKCIVLRNLDISNGKKYTIEIHHEPFSLFDITETVLNKYMELDMPINSLNIADEIMELHYQGKVGLVPLSKTIHQSVTDGSTFIPLQLVYQKYDVFHEEYSIFMSEALIRRLEIKVDLSMKHVDVTSSVLEPEFTYVKIDGFDLPVVPDEWGDIFRGLS